MRTLLRSCARFAIALVAGPTLFVGFTANTFHSKPVYAAANGAWTEYHHDDGHTGFDPSLPQVTQVNTGWVSPALDGQVYASVLVYNGLVYAATLNDTVYALNQSTGAVVWSHHLGAPQTTGWDCGNVSPQGILGTPIIDTAASRIYVAAFFSNDQYWVYGLDLATGTTQLSTLIPATIGSGFDWKIQQERGALALHNGYVYVPFGGRDGDCADSVTGQPYYGWVVGVATNGSTTPAVYQTACAGCGIWAAGGPVVDDATGNVFASTGNGIANGCDTVNQNDAVVRLSPALALQDYFMPNDWQNGWCTNDQDLGSAGPLLINSNLLFQAGKAGGGFLLNPNNLGGVNGQAFPAQNPYNQADVCHGNIADATFGSFAYAAPFVYVECEGRGIVALNTNPSTPAFSVCDATCASPPDWSAGAGTTYGPPIVAAGAVWAASGGGGLTAFNAMTGAVIYQSAGFSVHRFVSPSEAGGQVFVPSDNVVRSFGMVVGNTWSSLGGTLASGPDAASWDSNRLDVFSKSSSNALQHVAWNGSSWSVFESLGGVITSAPTAVSWGSNRIDVFARGQNNGLWHKWWNGSSWSGWYPLGGVLSSGADAASWGSGRLDIFARGQDNGLWHIAWTGTGWTQWQSLGGQLTSDPTAVSWGPNRVDVFARGLDNGLWHIWWTGTAWSSWYSLGGTLTSGPDASSCLSGHLDVFALGSGSALNQIGWTGAAWTGWMNWGNTWASDPGAVCRSGSAVADVFEQGTDNALWHAQFLSS